MSDDERQEDPRHASPRLSQGRGDNETRERVQGEDDAATLCEASNLAFALASLVRFDEAKALLRRMMPVARRAVGSSHITTLRTRFIYAAALYEDPAATLDDLREAVTTLEDTKRTARRVLGAAHPTTEGIEEDLEMSRAALRARETPSTSA